MKKVLIAALISSISTGAFADEAAKSPHQVSSSLTVVSDYNFRGLTQSWHQPVVQGSVDYAHSSGLFATLWASTLSAKVIAGTNVEVDLILGYKGAINERFNYGGGVTAAFYPGGNWNKMRWGDRPDQKYDFAEANVFIGYRWITLKYSEALNDLNGFNEKTGFSASTKGSSYVEVNADIPLMESGFVLGLHVGREDFTATAGGFDPDFTDYRISLSKTFADGWLGVAQITENSNSAFFNGTRSNMNEFEARDVGKRRFALSLTKYF